LLLAAEATLAQTAPPRRTGLPDPAHRLEGAALVKALQAGGFTIYFRHSSTDMSQQDASNFVATNCAVQRNLSEGGRAQARLIGEGFRALNLPVGEVIASPFCRTMETARLIAGHAAPEEAVLGHSTLDFSKVEGYGRLAKIVATPPRAGTHRVISGHTGGYDFIGGPTPLEEGEAAVFLALDGIARIVARVQPADWKSLATSGDRSSAPDPGAELRGPALAKALLAGGLTLYFRHGATDFSQRDRPAVEAADCATQRNLSEAGRAQMRQVGEAIARLKLPLGEVLASPYCRTMETARLAAGRATPEEAIRGRASAAGGAPDYAGLATLLQRRLNKGTPLRIVVGHGNGFRSVAGSPHLEEGEAAVLRTNGNGWIVVARILPRDWDLLRAD
jgi:broad specificity phosphatase PhoE